MGCSAVRRKAGYSLPFPFSRFANLSTLEGGFLTDHMAGSLCRPLIGLPRWKLPVDVSRWARKLKQNKTNLLLGCNLKYTNVKCLAQ